MIFNDITPKQKACTTEIFRKMLSKKVQQRTLCSFISLHIFDSSAINYIHHPMYKYSIIWDLGDIPLRSHDLLIKFSWIRRNGNSDLWKKSQMWLWSKRLTLIFLFPKQRQWLMILVAQLKHNYDDEETTIMMIKYREKERWRRGQNDIIKVKRA